MTNEEMKKAKKRYNEQKNGCRCRHDKNGNFIEMRLTFDEWLDIWLSSEHYHKMGACRGHYVMSRYNDIGHYEIGNVFIQLHSDNVRDNNANNQFQEKSRARMIEQRKDPVFQAKNKAAVQTARNKPISCDGQIFPSATQAAQYLAPVTRLTDKSKQSWFEAQMKKYPERYFYI